MTDETALTAGELEKPEDAGSGESGQVARWVMELALADKVERAWRKKAQAAIDRYRDEKDRTDWQYNILWSNTEVLRPHLYGATPKADVRQRFRDPDPVGTVAAEVTERALDYSIQTTDFDGEMNLVILDYLLTGRAVARVRFEPQLETDATGEPVNMTYAACRIERVAWDRFRRGPGITRSELPWIAYQHQLSMSEVEEQFPGCRDKVQYDVQMAGVEKDQAAEEPSVFKRVTVWEIWDKRKKEILFLAPSCPDGFLKREPDKLNLEGFFDSELLYSVEGGNTLVPQPEYEMYRDQAKELDRITVRISKLVTALKVRGIYDGTVTEFKELFKAADNEMIPVSQAVAAMAAGGLDKAVWMMPIETAALVLKELYVQREQIKQTIYELTGVSDILRGSTDPDETLGAQQLKAQTGGMRLQRRQRDVQRFVRNLIRKKAEVICENYPPDLLAVLTGIKLPHDADKVRAQQQMQMMQQQAQQQQMMQAQQQPQQPGQAPQQPGMGHNQPPAPPPELLAVLNSPTWEDVMKVLTSDMLRAFSIDIETDSTIAADQAAERQQVTDLITGMGSFFMQMTPAVEGGVISIDAAKKILNACLRRFKLGREVEDVLEHDQGRPQPQKPDPEAAKAQAQMQLEQFRAQSQMQLEDKKYQNAVQLAQATQAAQAQQDAEAQQQETVRKERELQLSHRAELEKMQFDHRLELEKIAAQNQAKLQQRAHDAAADRDQLLAQHQMEREKMGHQLQLKAAEIGDAQQGRSEARDHERAVNNLTTEEEMKEIADAMRQLAASIAQSHTAGQEHAARHTELMTRAVTLMAAPTVAVRDAQGKIVGARKHTEEPT